MDKQQLQEELAEHQVPVEKLQKVAHDLMEIEGEPAPDRKHVQETTGMKQQWPKRSPATKCFPLFCGISHCCVQASVLLARSCGSKHKELTL